MGKTSEKTFIATRNACKMCTPLGASIAFKGIEGCVPLIHGSQGCATYIRRYLISHYKEPVDIASTNFTEESAIFGGKANLYTALKNVTNQYKPKIIGIATTCLSETIGDDMKSILSDYREENKYEQNLPFLIYVNTPSYSGTHSSGFYNTVYALVKYFAKYFNPFDTFNLLPGFLSPADIRLLKRIMADFQMNTILIPDYSETLDYEYTGEYESIPAGGTTMNDLIRSGSSKATIEFGYILNRTNSKSETAGEYFKENFNIPHFKTGIPIGIKETDSFFNVLEILSGKSTPEKYVKQKGRLIDSYVDGHKYLFGKKAVVYGEEDLVVALVSFLEEIGVHTVLCASGGNSGHLKKTIEEKVNPKNRINIRDDCDFEEIAAECKDIKPDILIGNSKGYYISRELNIPLIRVGFPVHDRIGGQRIRHIGYEGTQELFDKIVNALIEYKQDHSPVGYKYM